MQDISAKISPPLTGPTHLQQTCGRSENAEEGKNTRKGSTGTSNSGSEKNEGEMTQEGFQHERMQKRLNKVDG